MVKRNVLSGLKAKRLEGHFGKSGKAVFLSLSLIPKRREIS